MKLYNSVDSYICPVCDSIHALDSGFFITKVSNLYNDDGNTPKYPTPNLFKCRTCNFIFFDSELIFDPRWSSPRTIPADFGHLPYDFGFENFTHFQYWGIPSHEDFLEIVTTGSYQCNLPIKQYSYPSRLVEARAIISKYHAGGFVRETFYQDTHAEGNVITRKFPFKLRKIIYLYLDNQYTKSLRKADLWLETVKYKIENKLARNPYDEDYYQEALIKTPLRQKKLIKQQKDLSSINL